MRLLLILLCIAAALTSVGFAARPNGLDEQRPIGGLFQLVWPDVQLGRGEQDALADGRVVGTILDARHPAQLVFLGAARIDVTPGAFISAVANTAALWRGPKVPRTGAFTQPAVLSDVEAMQLPDADLDALRQCRPGDCGVKVSANEMQRLAEAARRDPERWREALQREFRSVVVDRIRAYQASGMAGLTPFHDHEAPIDPARAFSEVAKATDLVNETAKQLVEYLAHYPAQPLPHGAGERIYWLQTVQTPKPTIQALHGSFRLGTDDPAVEAVVVSRQVFATHYVNASLAVTALVRDDAGNRYLFYMNRSAADGLEGAFRGLRRFFIERRIRPGARDAFAELKTRIEQQARRGGK